MRTGGLYQNQNRERGIPRAVSVGTTVVFLALTGYILIRYKNFAYLLRERPFFTPYFLYLAGGYLALIIVSVLIIRRANCAGKRTPAAWAIAVLLLALAPRLYLFSRGSFFGPGGGTQYTVFSIVMTAQTATLVQILSSACSAVLLYLVARRFDENSAPAAGILCAVYPAAIAGSLSPGGAQVSIFLALLSLLLLLFALSSVRRVRAVVAAALSGLSLALGCRMTGSLRVVAVAFAVFWFVLFVSSFRLRKEPVRLLLVALAFCAAFVGLSAVLPREGGESPLFPGVSSAQGESNLPDGGALDWDTIRERFVSDGGPSRFDQDIARLWMEKDGSFDLAADTAAPTEGDAALLRAAQRLDFFFVAGVFLFSWIGALLRRRCGTGELLLMTLLVWMGAQLFLDIDAEGRAFNMPLLILFAAYGFFAVTGARHKQEREPQAGCVTRLIDRSDGAATEGEPEKIN